MGERRRHRRQFPRQRIRVRFRHEHVTDLAHERLRIPADHVHGLHRGRPPGQLMRLAPAPVEQDRHRPPDRPPVEVVLLDVEQILQPRQPVRLFRLADLVSGCRGGRSGARAVFERIRLGEADRSDQRHRRLEIGLLLAGVTDDEIGREREIGPRRAQSLYQVDIVRRRVAPAHRGEHPVGTRLDRQVEIGHQRGQLAMGGDQVLVHVARMGGRIANAREAGQVGERADQPAETPFGSASRSFAVIGVHVLPQKGDLARAPLDQPSGLRDDRSGGARMLRAPCVGDDAERAELVAALLNRQERRRPLGGAFFGKAVELRLGREVDVEQPPLAGLGPAHQFGQAVIGLGPDNNVDPGRAAHDFRSLGLGDAAGHHDDTGTLPPVPRASPRRAAQAAEVGKQLLRRLFADVAGVEDGYLGLVGAIGLRVAVDGHDIGHSTGVIDVHLASITLDEEPLCQ